MRTGLYTFRIATSGTILHRVHWRDLCTAHCASQKLSVSAWQKHLVSACQKLFGTHTISHHIAWCPYTDYTKFSCWVFGWCKPICICHSDPTNSQLYQLYYILHCGLSLNTIHIPDWRHFSDSRISQSSVATCLRRDEIFKHQFVANLLPRPSMKTLWKSVNFWWSCEEEFGVLFFDSQCTTLKNWRQSALLVAHFDSCCCSSWSILPLFMSPLVLSDSPSITAVYYRLSLPACTVIADLLQMLAAFVFSALRNSPAIVSTVCNAFHSCSKRSFLQCEHNHTSYKVLYMSLSIFPHLQSCLVMHYNHISVQ